MSLQTWKEEFYPVPVESLAPDLPDLALVQHSLKKWEGLTPENLQKHGVKASSGYIENAAEDKLGGLISEILPIDAYTCSLCDKYIPVYEKERCDLCPLYKALGNNSCDDKGMPFKAWAWESDPKPMIAGLRRAVVNLEKGEGK